MQPADIHTNEEKITDDSFKMLQDGLRLCRFPKGLRGGPLRDAEHVSQSQLDEGHGREEHFIVPNSEWMEDNPLLKQHHKAAVSMDWSMPASEI